MSRPDQNNPNAIVAKNSKTRRNFLLGLMLALGLFVFFLPAIVVNSPLKKTAIDYALSDINGSIHVSQISAGWFTPIELKGIALKDEGGQDILTVDSVKSSQSLLGFLVNSDLGVIEIVRPVVDLVVRRDGSNIEDAFSNYINAPSEESNTSIPRIKMRLVDGVASIRSNTLPQPGIIENINALVQCMDSDIPLSAQLQMQCSTDQHTIGNIEINVVADQGKTEFAGESIQAEIQASQLPLAALAPVLTRLIGPANCAGSIDGKILAAIDTNNGSVEVELSNFNARQIAFVAPELIGDDQFTAHNMTASGQLALNSKSITANQFKVETEFARINAEGQFDFQQLAQLASGNELPQSGFQLDGVIDLAQIAAMLPETTRVRNGVAMNSGILQITANSRTEGQGSTESHRMVINADAANVNFNIDGQQVAWNKPLRAIVVAVKRNGQLMLEEIGLESDFLTVSGFASINQGKLQVDGDLKKVIEQVGQIIDTEGLKLDGQINGQMDWQIDSDVQQVNSNEATPIRLNGQFNIQNPMFEFPGMNPWSEQEIDIAFDGNATADKVGNVSVNAGTFDIRIDNEVATGSLHEPIQNLFTNTKFQFNCVAKGSINKWLVQARNFAEFPEFFADGDLNSQFLLTLNPQTLRLNQIQFEATDCSFDGFSMHINEPKVTGRANLKYHYSEAIATFTNSRLASASFAANTDQLVFHMSEKMLADGVVSFRANANRASNWIGLSMPGDSVRWDGSATGSMTFKSEPAMFGGDLAVVLKELVFVQPATTASNEDLTQQVGHRQSYVEFWREPDLKVASTIALTDDFNNMHVAGLRIQSKTADVEATGSINELASTMTADLNGRWNVKWDKVNQTIRELAGDVIEFQGDGWQPIKIKGPLYDATTPYAWIPDQLSAIAALTWQQASLFNVPLGTSHVDIRLDQSLANLSSPKNSNLVDKVFQMKPILDLRNADPVLLLEQGTMLDQWNVTTDDSRTWLKYAAPLVADATSAQGQVSVNIEGANVPLFDPMKSSAQGSIDIHDLTIGPGPLIQQLIPMIDQVRAIVKPGSSNIQEKTSWMKLKPQQLPFAVQEGRVHHDGFEMSYKDVVIRTRGSVGFDQSLNMIAEIPILEDWVGGNKMLSRLIGKSISIPISGSLSKPQLDRRAVSQLTQQLIRESAVGAFNDKVNKEVGKLQEKVGNKVQDEFNQLQNKVNNKVQTEFEDKLKNELRGGLNELFGGGDK